MVGKGRVVVGGVLSTLVPVLALVSVLIDGGVFTFTRAAGC